jgi:hypothetical protein
MAWNENQKPRLQAFFVSTAPPMVTKYHLVLPIDETFMRPFIIAKVEMNILTLPNIFPTSPQPLCAYSFPFSPGSLAFF